MRPAMYCITYSIKALHNILLFIVIVIVIVSVITFLFTKLPWPGDSEMTFRSSSQAATYPSVYHTRWRLHAVPLNCWTSSREAVNTNFYSLWFDSTGNRTRVYRFSSRRSIHSTTDRLFLKPMTNSSVLSMHEAKRNIFLFVIFPE